MTLDKARELIKIQVYIGGGYNRNATKLILAEVQKDHGQEAVDQLIQEFNLEETFGFKPGSHFNY
ncbi:hypothetical protein [Kaarinaea lacus]